MTDNEIIDIYRRGRHEEAFNLIVENYSERLYWHLRRFLDCHEDTDDLLQDVFIKIWVALPSFRGEAQLFTWLYRIATNEVLNHLRKRRIKNMISIGTVSDYTEKIPENDPFFNGNHIQREFHKAIRKLPQKQRIVFNLRYFDDLKYEDISQITGTSVGALKASYYHAYNKIKEELQKYF